MANKKFDEFTVGNEMRVGDKPVGLRNSNLNENFIFDFPGSGIRDSFGNYLLEYKSSGSLSINHPKIINSLTNEPVIYTADGVDEDINISLDPKGSGRLILDGLNWPASDGPPNSVLYTDGNGNIGFTTESVLPTNIIGTADQVLANGSYGVPVSGVVTLTTPQDIGINSSPHFVAPTFVTPLLGTPFSGNLTNCNNLQLSTGVSGNLGVQHLNSGISADSTTFWRGDGTWAVPSGSGGSTNIIGTSNQVLANGTFGIPQSGTVTLTTPQDIATTSSPSFFNLNLTNPLSVSNGGTGRSIFTPNGILFAITTSTLSQITTVSNGVLLTNGVGTPVFSGSLTDGQIIIGSNSGPPINNTITAGTGISIVNSPGNITINSTVAGSSFLNGIVTTSGSITLTGADNGKAFIGISPGLDINAPLISSLPPNFYIIVKASEDSEINFFPNLPADAIEGLSEYKFVNNHGSIIYIDNSNNWRMASSEVFTRRINDYVGNTYQLTRDDTGTLISSNVQTTIFAPLIGSNLSNNLGKGFEFIFSNEFNDECVFVPTSPNKVDGKTSFVIYKNTKCIFIAAEDQFGNNMWKAFPISSQLYEIINNTIYSSGTININDDSRGNQLIASGGNLIVNFPALSTLQSNFYIYVKSSTSNTVTVNLTNGATFEDGSTSYTFSYNEGSMLVIDSTINTGKVIIQNNQFETYKINSITATVNPTRGVSGQIYLLNDNSTKNIILPLIGNNLTSNINEGFSIIAMNQNAITGGNIILNVTSPNTINGTTTFTIYPRQSYRIIAEAKIGGSFSQNNYAVIPMQGKIINKFIPAETNASSSFSNYRTRIVAPGGTFSFNFVVPFDFLKIIAFEIVYLIPVNNFSANPPFSLNCQSQFGTPGSSAVSGGSTNPNFSFSPVDSFSLNKTDLSSLLNGISAGQYGNIKIMNSIAGGIPNNVEYLGINFSYVSNV